MNYSACLDVAVFVLTNPVFWRLLCHVRLCCCLLVGSDLSLVDERWFEQDVVVSLENDKSGMGGFGR